MKLYLLSRDNTGLMDKLIYQSTKHKSIFIVVNQKYNNHVYDFQEYLLYRIRLLGAVIITDILLSACGRNKKKKQLQFHPYKTISKRLH